MPFEINHKTNTAHTNQRSHGTFSEFLTKIMSVCLVALRDRYKNTIKGVPSTDFSAKVLKVALQMEADPHVLLASSAGFIVVKPGTARPTEELEA